MRALLIAATLLAAAALPAAAEPSAYDFSFTSIDGKPLPMTSFKGKPVLVVNTASQCGFTPQYTGLEALYTKYKDKGLVVLGVPSNDFGGQEPGDAADIKHFCEANYSVDFPMTDKYDVVGAEAHPFYKWAGAAKGEPKWNFHKYLLDGDGKLVAAYPSKVKPDDPQITGEIEKLLAKGS